MSKCWHSLSIVVRIGIRILAIENECCCISVEDRIIRDLEGVIDLQGDLSVNGGVTLCTFGGLKVYTC